ncbi:hypothetical protein Btru_044067 [Bulinus truncatus]|nr:hypothetical protein Btru_044067 [Bulinus truncatus]
MQDLIRLGLLTLVSVIAVSLIQGQILLPQHIYIASEVWSRHHVQQPEINRRADNFRHLYIKELSLVNCVITKQSPGAQRL